MHPWLKRVMAARCDHCPLCNYARANPHTMVGRAMTWHGKFCPFWRAWQDVHGAGRPEAASGGANGAAGAAGAAGDGR